MIISIDTYKRDVATLVPKLYPFFHSLFFLVNMNPTKRSSTGIIKIAPPIQQASIVSYEKRTDQKMWYIIKVIPQQMDYEIKPYTIARRYEGFLQLAQHLHEAFPTKGRAGSRLPKLNGKRIHLLHNKMNRQAELDKFIHALFNDLPQSISQSLLVLEFFGWHKADPLPQVSKARSPILRKSVSQPDLVMVHPLDTTSRLLAENKQQSPLWKRFRTATKTKPPQPVASTSTLTSLCSQAASVILPWRNNQPAPSFSTPQVSNNQRKKPSSASCITSVSTSSSSCCSQSTCATSIAPSPSTSPTLLRTIKIKVIYDLDNIIVVQVPRSITLADLRARIAQKFSCEPAIQLPTDFVLLFNDTRSSASSSTSAASSFSVDSSSGTATLIAKEQDLAHAMGTLWVRHEKVTLRCIS